MPDHKRLTIFGWFNSNLKGCGWLVGLKEAGLYRTALLTGGIWTQHTELVGKIKEKIASPLGATNMLP